METHGRKLKSMAKLGGKIVEKLEELDWLCIRERWTSLYHSLLQGGGGGDVGENGDSGAEDRQGRARVLSR